MDTGIHGTQKGVSHNMRRLTAAGLAWHTPRVTEAQHTGTPKCPGQYPTVREHRQNRAYCFLVAILAVLSVLNIGPLFWHLGGPGRLLWLSGPGSSQFRCSTAAIGCSCAPIQAGPGKCLDVPTAPTPWPLCQNKGCVYTSDTYPHTHIYICTWCVYIYIYVQMSTICVFSCVGHCFVYFGCPGRCVVRAWRGVQGYMKCQAVLPQASDYEHVLTGSSEQKNRQAPPFQIRELSRLPQCQDAC